MRSASARADVHNEQLQKIPHDASMVIVNCGTNDVDGFGFYASGLPNGWERGKPAADAELHWCAFDPAVGNEIRKARTCVVVERD